MRKKINRSQIVAWGLLSGGSMTAVLGGLYGILPSYVEISLCVVLVLLYGFIIVIGELRHFARRNLLGFNEELRRRWFFGLTSIWFVVVGFLVAIVSKDGFFGIRVRDFPLGLAVHVALVSAAMCAGLHVLLLEIVQKLMEIRRRLWEWTSKKF